MSSTLNSSVGPAGANGSNGADGAGVVAGGTTGQVLAKASNDDFDTEWVDQAGSFIGARVVRTSDQSITVDSAWHKVDFTGMTCTYNSGVTYTAGTDPFTIVTAGKYLICGHIQWNDNGNTRGIILYRNSDTVAVTYTPSGQNSTDNISAVIDCAVDDVISMAGLKAGGDGTIKYYSPYTPCLTITKL